MNDVVDRVPRLAGKDHRFVDILWSIEGHQGYVMKLLSYLVCYKYLCHEEDG